MAIRDEPVGELLGQRPRGSREQVQCEWRPQGTLTRPNASAPAACPVSPGLIGPVVPRSRGCPCLPCCGDDGTIMTADPSGNGQVCRDAPLLIPGTLSLGVCSTSFMGSAQRGRPVGAPAGMAAAGQVGPEAVRAQPRTRPADSGGSASRGAPLTAAGVAPFPGVRGTTPVAACPAPSLGRPKPGSSVIAITRRAGPSVQPSPGPPQPDRRGAQ